MKLIDDAGLNKSQIDWFEKQIKALGVENFNAKGIVEKDNAVREALLPHSHVHADSLPALRELLDKEGLKKLSNSLASAKKRKNSTKKSLQLMLPQETILKLEAKAQEKGMTLSEWIQTLV